MTPAEHAFIEFMRRIKPARGHWRDGSSPTIIALAVTAATVLSALNFGLSPRPNNGPVLHFPTMGFFPAVVIVGYLRGAVAAWVAAGIASLVEVVKLSPEWFLAVDTNYLPWFLQYSLSLALCAGFSARGSKFRYGDKGPRMRKYILFVRNWFAAIPSLSQDLIEKRRAAQQSTRAIASALNPLG
jgi:hypothetical protein